MQAFLRLNTLAQLGCVLLAGVSIWIGIELYGSPERAKIKYGILFIPTAVWWMIVFASKDMEEPNYNRTVRPFWVLPRSIRLFFIVLMPGIAVGCLLGLFWDQIGGHA